MTGKLKKALVVLLLLCYCATAVAAADFEPENQPISRALAALSQEPVALMEVNNVHVSTSATGCYVSSVSWYDADWNPVYDGTFNTNMYHVQIQLTAMAGYYFPEDVTGYINNSECVLNRDASGLTVTLSRDYAPGIWAPSINNHPKSKTIDAGKYADFWASAMYTKSYTWYLLDPDGKRVELTELSTRFPEVNVSGGYDDTLIINNVPVGMNGWKVVCSFIGADGYTKKDSNAATITVRGAQPSPEPTPSPSPEPTPTPEPSPEPSPEVDPESEGEPTEHEHVFSQEWITDETGHWHVCDCGERADEGEHDFEWTVITAAKRRKNGEEQGVCKVCGYTSSRELVYEKGSSGRSAGVATVIIAVVGLLIAVVAIIVVQTVRENRRRRRRRRRRH